MDLLQWFMNFFEEKFQVVPLHLQVNLLLKMKNISNKELAEELHKPIIRK